MRISSCGSSTTDIYTLSLHDALPIFENALPPGFIVEVPLHGFAEAGGVILFWRPAELALDLAGVNGVPQVMAGTVRDRKSTRLNSSHLVISYAVFCLKQKKDTTLSAA